MINRRSFLKLGALSGMSVVSPMSWLSRPPAARPRPESEPEFAHSQNLRKFIEPMRQVGTGIPLAVKDTVDPGWWQPGVDHYTIDIAQFTDRLHPDLLHPTHLWGFGQGKTSGFKHLGSVIVATRDKPVQITFRNNLPLTHIIPVDDTIMGVMGNQNNRADIHLHGGLSPWVFDGGPLAWWDPNGHKGPSFLNNQVLRPGQPVPENEAEYYYPNHQSARLMWYHDHSFGTTRLNAYAGMASAFVITDGYEDALVANNHLPGPLDARTMYMVFQDKIFVSSSTAAGDNPADLTWHTIMPASVEGDLWYAHEYDSSVWTLNPGITPPDPSVIPEFFGDTILVNGTAYPYVEVERREYRLRMLNACNARFLNPRLVYADPVTPTEPAPYLPPGPSFMQIGTEGGFLPAPAVVNAPLQPMLLLGPAERADLIVDFRAELPGTVLLLYSDARAPFPEGADINDYYPGNPVNPTLTLAGKGPNTRTLLQFRVVAREGLADTPITLPATFTPTDPFLVPQIAGAPTPNPAGVKVRYLTLNEEFDLHGRLETHIGTDQAVTPGLFGRQYLDAPTEVIGAGETEVWELMNLTGDTHPMHFHLVNCQVLSRQAFDATNYVGGAPTYIGGPIAPDANEFGWKETVRMNPGEVTRVLMRFDLPVVPFKIPVSPTTGGHEYVWHCHILEHEEHDMMRPLIIWDKTYLPFVGKNA